MTNIQEVINRFDEKFDAPLAQWTETAIKDFLTSELTTLIEKQRNDIEGLRKKQPLSDEYLGNIFNHGLQFRGIEERDLIPAIETREVKAFNSGLDQVLSLRSLQ